MLLVKNGRVLDPQTGLDKTCDILIDGKRIVKLRSQFLLTLNRCLMRQD